MATHSVALVTRWIARIWSLLSILAVAMFAAGEILTGSGPRPTPQEWVGLALWPIGVAVGLIVAWYRETLGALLAIACLIGFCVWNLLQSGHLPKSLLFFVVAGPALVFLIAAFLSRRSVTPAA